MDRIPVKLPDRLSCQKDHKMSLYQEERAQFERELQRLKATQPPWWRRLGLWLRPE